MHSKQPKRLTTVLKKYCECVLWHRTYLNPCMSWSTTFFGGGENHNAAVNAQWLEQVKH